MQNTGRESTYTAFQGNVSGAATQSQAVLFSYSHLMPTWSCKQLNAELPACAYQGASLGSTPGPPTCRLYKQAAGLWQHKPSCSKLLLRPHPAKMRLVLQNRLCSRALLSCAAGKGKSLLMPGTQTQLKSKQPEIKHENSLTLSLFGTFLLSPSKTPGTKSTAQRSHS